MYDKINILALRRGAWVKMMGGDKDGVVLEVKGVVKRFGGIVALDGVDLNVERGKVTLLIGPNGSGKTTLVNVITGFIKPDKGKIIYEGRDITGLSPHVISSMGLVRTFQIPKPFMNLTVLENVLTAADRNVGENIYLTIFLRRLWRRIEKENAKKAFDILKLVGLDHQWDRRASELSGGQVKLLEIARALMKGARMIIMDEPAAGVNPRLAREIMERIRLLTRERGLTFLIIEHRIGLIKDYVDVVFAMNAGKIIAEGDPDTVLNDPRVLESYLGG